MGNLMTSQELLDKLQSAAKSAVSAEQVRKQRVSFIMGALKDTSNVTRERVSEILAKQDGNLNAKGK
jgi:hypothetical protein